MKNPLPQPDTGGAQCPAWRRRRWGCGRDLQAAAEVAEAVLDMEWLQRLNSLMEAGSAAGARDGGMLVLGVLLILGNTIRLAIESRREEIVVVKLVGGSNAFVRRPFLYTGLWYGVGGGAWPGCWSRRPCGS